MKLLAILMSALLAFATPTPVATETLSGRGTEENGERGGVREAPSGVF